MKIGLSILLFLFLTSVTLAQDETSIHKIDSLKKIIASEVHDSLEVKALRAWDELIYLYDIDMDWTLNKRIDSICKLNLKKKLSKKAFRFFTLCRAEANNIFGSIEQQTGKNEEALKHYNIYLNLCRKIDDQNGIAAAYSNIGIVRQTMGFYDEAADYYLKSLKIREKNGNKKGMAICYGNIAIAYKFKDELSMALKYNLKSLALVEKLEDDYSLSLLVNNIGTNIQDIGDSAMTAGNKDLAYEKYREALKYYERSLTITRKIKDVYGEGIALHNLGNVYSDLKEMTKAKDYYQQSLVIREELEDLVGMSSTINNLAIIYNEERNYMKALEYSTKALNLAKEAKSKEEVSYSARTIYFANKYLGRYKEALKFYELHIDLKDSLQNSENQKSIMQLQYKYEYEKQATEDSTKTAEEKKVSDALMAKRDAELQAEKNRKYLLYGGLTLVILFSIFIYNRFRITKKQKRIIEEQKKVVEIQKSEVEEAHHQLEEKNKEIMDSINYAKRIQAAILPPRKLVKEYLPDSFILYKPKDIVAGDFYWMSHSENSILFAACDCTGHGVPGAMVSVVCNNGLNRAVREYGLTEPGKILDKTRELVIQEFEKSEEEVKDGMDISICKLEIRNLKLNEEENNLQSQISYFKLSWAGANNPLWLIRNGELIEYKANKQPIGKFAESKPFTTHDIELQKGDTIYIFTDGFQDQFGGEKGKKFKAAKFKELLISVQNKSMEEQRNIIDETFESWKSGLEQNDDVCVIGIKIN